VLVFLLARVLGGTTAHAREADEVRVAVASNFAGTLKALSEVFHADTGHTVVPIVGATGKLFAQIQSGAPFDVFLSADSDTPVKLEAAGLCVKGSRQTYALGRLVLWSPDAQLVDAEGKVLSRAGFRHLAIANPKLAPYGGAAISVLGHLGLREKLADKLVEGESLAQAFAFVTTGNAELGFLALSQIALPGQPRTGSAWVVPPALYAPLRQDAVWLSRAQGNRAAEAFLKFLVSDKARALIRAAGYDLPEGRAHTF
jgi:molybdate transport system substrate-binding protein